MLNVMQPTNQWLRYWMVLFAGIAA